HLRLTGIFLFRKLKDLSEWCSKEFGQQVETSPPETFIVQKYVENPYLLAGRKFDLRIYTLVTSFHPLKVWLAREGFARLSGELFDLENIDDSRVHLTNMAIQLKTTQTGDDNKQEPKKGCKWALTNVREYLTARHGPDAVQAVFQRIAGYRPSEPITAGIYRSHAGVIMASLLAVQSVIMQGKNSFELYGYDTLLDEDLTPWLLEVNASPALTGTDSHDYRLKFDLVDDALNVLDLEARFSASEARIGGFDLLWNDGPVWTRCPNPSVCGDGGGGGGGGDRPSTTPPPSPTIIHHLRKLNVFLGARNDDRVEQLRRLGECLEEKKIAAGCRILPGYSRK
ncbi:unnamed protein product, partial [Heterotrigona itama]